MDYDDLKARFGEKVAEKVPMTSKGPIRMGKGPSFDDLGATPQCEVWEIWDKKHEKVFWMVEGYPVTLDIKDDPLELDNFFPEPPPMMATTTHFVRAALQDGANFYIRDEQACFASPQAAGWWPVRQF
jgi:hypothetical protein